MVARLRPLLNWTNAAFCKSLPFLLQLHAQILIHGNPISLCSKLAGSYLSCGCPNHARQVFDHMPTKNIGSWITMLSGYLSTKSFSEVLLLYQLYRADSQSPNSHTLVFALRACAALSLEEAASFHSEAIKFGLEADSFVSPSLINVYHSLGSLEDAEKVFKQSPLTNPTVWGLMMKAYSKASMDLHVMESFARMRVLCIQLNPCAAVCLARAYGNHSAAEQGRAIHSLCVKSAAMASNAYLRTSLVDMYMKSGFIRCACKMFEEMPSRDVVSWSTMIARLAQCGRGYESLRMFRGMLAESILPNAITLASVLLACSQMGCLRQGKGVHGFALRHAIQLDVVASTALLDMYAKTGSIDIAHKVFVEMRQRNVCAWTAMIGGFGLHGMGSRALDLFDRMRSAGVLPNAVTFASLLSACSRAGMVRRGRECFESMGRDYGIAATDEHYSCMVDLFGRAGFIEEAEALVEGMPAEPGASVWGALLGAYKIHKREEQAEIVAKKLFGFERELAGAHVLLSNIYGEAEMWEMVKKTREQMSERGLRKEVGFSSIEIDGKVCVFDTCDAYRCLDLRVAAISKVLRAHMKE